MFEHKNIEIETLIGFTKYMHFLVINIVIYKV